MFVISDTHWGHDNIVRFCNRPLNHDELMAQRWNEAVADGDVVLHLGDVCAMSGGKREWWAHNIAPFLNGTKLLVLGNHDVRKPRRRESLHNPQPHGTVTLPHREGEWQARAADIDFFEATGFHVIAPPTLRFGALTVTAAHYPRDMGGADSTRLHLHGHIHNNGYGQVGEPHVPHMKNNINVSVEVRDYTPQRIDSLLGLWVS
jgi:calcineurin-like phosphoesterase family protein